LKEETQRTSAKMATTVRFAASELPLEARPLNQDEFSSFGTVIENPAPGLVPTASLSRVPPNAVQANQGSALKFLDVTHMLDLYGSAVSKRSSKAVMNMFVCAPRDLRSSSSGFVQGLFPVEVLERHPFTTQTFIPLGLSPAEQAKARYLVIVAPSLPPSSNDQSFPVPTGDNLPGRGLPDLTRLRAFIATGAQAITYGAGTWHAPMVAIGQKLIDFVVVQFANGVGIEDCQEAFIEAENGRGTQITVAVPRAAVDRGSKL
jgi:ureidoglycolate lyase